MSDAKYKRLQSEIEKLEKERDQAIGAKKQILQTLKTEFKCDSIEEAEKLLEKLRKEQIENEKKFKREFRKFEKAFDEYKRSMEMGSDLPKRKKDKV